MGTAIIDQNRQDKQEANKNGFIGGGAALNDLQLFINRFPNSARVDTCNLVMNQLRFKLQTKEVMNVRLYSKTENYRAATVTATSFLENFPVSEYREEVFAILN